MPRKRWDAIVVGGGATGTATAWHLARRGRAVFLVERFTIGHERGSSHGPTRIFRLSYHHPDYVRMARRALQEWRALEAAAGERLLHGTGGLEAGPGARRNADALAAAGEPFSWLRAGEVEDRWPGIRVPVGADVLFQPDAGVVLADRTVKAQARVAAALGASLLEDSPVVSMEAGDDEVVVRTGRGDEHRAPVAVIAAGGWAGPLLAAAGVTLPLQVTEEQVHYVREGSGGPVPTLIEWADPPTGPAYLLPNPLDQGVIKVAEHVAGSEVTADTRTFSIDQVRRERTMAFARRWLRQPGDERGAETCLYTNTPDEDFVLDRIGPLVIGSPCSGHGFKFAPLVGSVLADLATGASPPDVPLGRFSLSRFHAGALR
jgi:sarcosine oxidase